MTADEGRVWMNLAADLDAENRQLRVWLYNILAQVALRDEVYQFGLEEIERRWPERVAA